MSDPNKVFNKIHTSLVNFIRVSATDRSKAKGISDRAIITTTQLLKQLEDINIDECSDAQLQTYHMYKYRLNLIRDILFDGLLIKLAM